MARVTIQYVANNTTRELIQIDVTTAEDHEFSSKATMHPIEDGSSISDHIIKNTGTLSLTGIISDDPISINSAPVENIDGVSGSPVGGASTTQSSEQSSKIGSGLIASGSGKISKIAMEIFKSMHNDRLLLTIITGLETYTNMVLESFKVNQTARTANALPFTATFREVKIAVSEIVEVPIEAINEDVKDSATKKQNKGKLSTTNAEGKEEEKGASLLLQLARKAA